MSEIISIENVSYGYDDKKDVIKNVSLHINEGEYVTVLGHNGSGKSTLIKLMNGRIVPDKGRVLVSGIDTHDINRLFDVRKCCGMVFQNPDNQLVATSVEEDVAFGLENIGVKREEMEERIGSALRAVSMEEYRKREPSLLSGGQKQRVAIAGILAMRPKVILLDEATAMLDPKGRNEVMDIVDKLNNDMGITVIHVTHYMDQALLSSRSIVVNDGEIVLDDMPINVLRNPKISELSLMTPNIIRLMEAFNIEMEEFSYEGVWDA
ncbi:MAG: energy-coupling factor transporter ATPase, partial [Lachnospiraceae bacterium]|nr:energy-coupling factor transporter ATPase [Lachnospiraceae bacterium]